MMSQNVCMDVKIIKNLEAFSSHKHDLYQMKSIHVEVNLIQSNTFL